MAHIVNLGAGNGGMPMPYEMCDLARAGDRITVVSGSSKFPFVASNPWLALPQIPPRNGNWFRQSKRVPLSKVAVEKGLLRKMKAGPSETIFEKMVLKVLGIRKLQA